MADSVAGSLYEQQFRFAVKLFDDGDTDKCIEEAKKNLSDPTLPRYYIIRTCVLIASAFDDWADADIWVSRGELCYITSLGDAERKRDLDSLEALKQLRGELDALKEFRAEDMAKWTRETMEGPGFGDVDMDEEDVDEYADEREYFEDDDYFEDSVAVAEAENEVEVAADALRLPIRPATEQLDPLIGSPQPGVYDDSTPSVNLDSAITNEGGTSTDSVAASTSQNDGLTPAANVHDPTAENLPAARRKLKKQKSMRFSPGGAFHAHAFSKTVGKEGTSHSSAPDLDFSRKK